MSVTLIPGKHFNGGANLNEGARSGPDASILEEKLNSIISLLNTNETDIAAIEVVLAGKDRKESVRLATAAALGACTAAGTGEGKTLTQNVAAIENIDGQAPVVGNRVLVKNQVAGADNGIYTVTVVGTGAVQQVLTRAIDADDDTEVTSGMTVAVEEGTVNADTTWFLTTDEPFTLDTDALVFAEFVPVEHAAAHERGGADEIDGDHLDIDWNPTNYVPAVTPAEAANVDDLTAHLYGVDVEMANMEQHLGVSASVQLIQGGQPVPNDTLVVGVDTYEADGVGANINFAISGVNAEGTMDNLLAAAVANGTENLFWDKLSATNLRLRAADVPQGTIIGADPDIALSAAALTNYDFDSGDVNMNTLAGRAAGQIEKAVAVLEINAGHAAAGSVRVAFPFTPVAFQVLIITAAGVLKMAATDTFAIDGDDILITLIGGGGDIVATDVVTIVAWA